MDQTVTICHKELCWVFMCYSIKFFAPPFGGAKNLYIIIPKFYKK